MGLYRAKNEHDFPLVQGVMERRWAARPITVIQDQRNDGWISRRDRQRETVGWI